MRISGSPNISAPTPKSLTQVTGTRKGDKRATDVNIIGNATDFNNAFNDPRFSIALAPGATDFYFYTPVPTNTTRTVHNTEDGFKVYFDVSKIVLVSHKDADKCVIIINGVSLVILTSYDIMRSKRLQYNVA